MKYSKENIAVMLEVFMGKPPESVLPSHQTEIDRITELKNKIVRSCRPGRGGKDAFSQGATNTWKIAMDDGRKFLITVEESNA